MAKFIEIDCINNLEDLTTYKALVNVNHIVELWADGHGLINIRVAAGQYVSEYSTLNTFEEIKTLLKEVRNE